LFSLGLREISPRFYHGSFSCVVFTWGGGGKAGVVTPQEFSGEKKRRRLKTASSRADPLGGGRGRFRGGPKFFGPISEHKPPGPRKKNGGGSRGNTGPGEKILGWSAGTGGGGAGDPGALVSSKGKTPGRDKVRPNGIWPPKSFFFRYWRQQILAAPPRGGQEKFRKKRGGGGKTHCRISRGGVPRGPQFAGRFPVKRGGN